MSSTNIHQSDLFELLASQLNDTIGLLDKMACDVQNILSGSIKIDEAFAGSSAAPKLLVALQAEDRIRQRLEAAVRACRVGSDVGALAQSPISVDELKKALKLSELVRDLHDGEHLVEEEAEIELF
ncbi:MAG: hypothetical protein COA52_14440 [Hyphomicrobiales bacterium]|nr:hypothetical protein [Hyphomicrobiales bacterium]PCJ87038.1 MAG: hypothetical protein COA52_14440 [Hyphomicrobiales bacterium]